MEKISAADITLAKNIAKKYQRKFPRWHDEIESAALWGLYCGIENYNKMYCNVKPRDYIRSKVVNKIKDEIQKLVAQRDNNHERLDEIEDLYIKNKANMLDEREAVNYLINKLPRNMHKVFKCIYLQNKTQTQTAKELGKSHNAVSRAHANGVKILREMGVDREGAIV